ncbi:helix-turn-helix domain-containing protein [Streptomyces sp. NRRL S-1022]|uniref:helix-turn-helix domain-containing protein n=1 Tax=Streptomyces sp. NRRL S-1022 TaxID=1463880 RepID=UPI0006905E3A|nr:helix-turn-helix transcriptional regulator [Streptomyces sp. NRRL S-1022]
MTDSQVAPAVTAPTSEAIISANVRRLRKTLNLTQTALAERVTAAGIPFGDMAVWGVENGKRRINVDDLYALAHALQTTPRELLSAEPEALSESLVYEVRFDGGSVERVSADRVETDEHGWLNFYEGEHRVLFASVARVLCVRVQGTA